ncbi:MAG TPA: hypothetical protein VIP56_04000, partial [Nitrososphaeraceae archaeon]
SIARLIAFVSSSGLCFSDLTSLSLISICYHFSFFNFILIVIYTLVYLNWTITLITVSIHAALLNIIESKIFQNIFDSL